MATFDIPKIGKRHFLLKFTLFLLKNMKKNYPFLSLDCPSVLAMRLNKIDSKRCAG
jgi:hypothetical protein